MLPVASLGDCVNNRLVGSSRPSSTSDQPLRQGQLTRHEFLSLIWHRSAAIVLSTPVLSAAALESDLILSLASGGDPPRTSFGSGGDGGGGRGGDGATRAHNEIFQLANNKPITLTLVSFAVTRKAYGRITRQFLKDYKEKTGRTVKFRLSFGGSGTQARAVIDGLPADIAALALPLDIIKIQEAGLIDPGWEKKFPNNSNVCESVVSLVTRQGNPKNIVGWEDLIRDDVKVIVANPKTAGVARWIFLALWGHKMNKGEAAAKKYVTKVFDNVEIMPRDAREASDVFYSQKFGDVLLTYENEAVFTNLVVSPQNPLPYVCPPNNVRIVCPASTIDRNLKEQDPEVGEAAAAFISFLFTPGAQREFTDCGFRSANKEVQKETTLPSVKGVWDVEKKLGKWPEVQRKFFDEGVFYTQDMLTMQYAPWEERHGYYGDFASPLNKPSLGAFANAPGANKPAGHLIDSNNFEGKNYLSMHQWQSPVLPSQGLGTAGGSFATDPTNLFDDDHNSLLFSDPSSEEWNDAQPGSGSSDALDLMGEAAMGSVGSLTQLSLLGGPSSAPHNDQQQHQQQLIQDPGHELQHLSSMHSSHTLHWSASGPFATTTEEQHHQHLVGGGQPPAPFDSSTAQVPLPQETGVKPQRRQVKKIRLADPDGDDALDWDSGSDEAMEAEDGYGSDEDYQVDGEEEEDDFVLEGHLHTTHNGRKRSLGGFAKQPRSRPGVAMQSLNTGLRLADPVGQTIPTGGGAPKVGRPRLATYKQTPQPQLQQQQQPYGSAGPSHSDGDTKSARISRRLQQRGSQPFQGHLPLGDDFVTYDAEEPLSPDRATSPAPAPARKGRPASNASRAGGSGSAAGRSASGRRRTISVAAQRIRATSSRHELKGRPSFAEIVESGFMRPGSHKFAVGNVEVTASVGDDGAINYNDTRYRAISKFALVVLRERNPSRQSCDGWKEVAWNGEKLDTLRIRVQQHVRQQARRG